jgi:hypothetical protein
MATRRSVGGSLLALALSVSMGACNGASVPPSPVGPSIDPSVAASASPAPATAVPPSASTSSPEASAAVTVDLGAVGTTPRGSLVTVHSFGPSDRSPEPPAGAAWYEADLEWCLPPTIVSQVTVGNIRYELGLLLDDDTTIEPEANADGPDEIYASGGKGGMRWRLS